MTNSTAGKTSSSATLNFGWVIIHSKIFLWFSMSYHDGNLNWIGYIARDLTSQSYKTKYSSNENNVKKKKLYGFKGASLKLINVVKKFIKI